jgi:hypothetical protein
MVQKHLRIFLQQPFGNMKTLVNLLNFSPIKTSRGITESENLCYLGMGEIKVLVYKYYIHYQQDLLLRTGCVPVTRILFWLTLLYQRKAALGFDSQACSINTLSILDRFLFLYYICYSHFCCNITIIYITLHSVPSDHTVQTLLSSPFFVFFLP